MTQAAFANVCERCKEWVNIEVFTRMQTRITVTYRCDCGTDHAVEIKEIPDGLPNGEQEL